MPFVSRWHRLPWLFSPAVDLAAFGGSAVVALTLLAVGWARGLLANDTPEWFWVTGVLLVDVAHVWATAFRVYFVPAEFRRRRALYVLAPVLAWLLGAALYSENPQWFWRVLAYLAVFHFVRQQYGWVAWYRARGNETDRLGHLVDAAAIYLATLYPLAYWHGHLPRAYWWFLPNDFAALPPVLATLLWPLYCLALVAYGARSVGRGLKHGHWSPGKDLVVASTAACWYAGIVAFNSDYAFAVTNVLIHGIPYLVLVFWYGEHQQVAATGYGHRGVRLLRYLAVVWLLAYAEELLWHRTLWHERNWLFGEPWSFEAMAPLWVPLLAVPQATHYVLDGFLWRRTSSPGVREMLDR